MSSISSAYKFKIEKLVNEINRLILENRKLNNFICEARTLDPRNRNQLLVRPSHPDQPELGVEGDDLLPEFPPRTTDMSWLTSSAHADAMEDAELKEVGEKYGITLGLDRQEHQQDQQGPRDDFSLHSSRVGHDQSDERTEGGSLHPHHTHTFEAMHPGGRQFTGSMVAPNDGVALAKLREKGLFPTKIKELPSRR